MTKPRHYDFAIYHLKRLVRYLNAAYNLGLFVQICTYRCEDQNVNHLLNHRNGGLNCGHAVGALFVNVVLGPEVASEVSETYYGGGRFHESFLGWLRKSRKSGRADDLVSMIEAASWNL
eukprot:s1590_g5.t1